MNLNRSTLWKFLLPFFGIIILIVGLVAGYTANQWVALPLAIITIGAGIFLVGFVLLTRSFWQRRSTQTGVNALVAILAFVTIIGSLNVLAVRYDSSLDLTENQLYSLAPQSQKLVKNLEKPLRVVVFESPPSPENQRILRNYQQYSPNFSFEFVDPQTDRAQVQAFGVQNYGEVHLEYGDQKQFVQQLTQSEPISEVKLTNAIEIVQRDRELLVYFLQGHGEPPLEAVEGGISQAAETLKNQGYQVQPLNLTEQDEFADNQPSVLVIASPQRNLLSNDIDAIQDYVANGGNLFLLLGFKSNSDLDEMLLEDWGIKLDDRIILDQQGQQFGLGTVIVNRYGQHPITNAFQNGISIFPLSRPIDIEDKEGVKTTSLAYTDQQTWAQQDLTEQQPEYNPEQDRKGPFVIGYALERLEDASSKETDEQDAAEQDSSSKETDEQQSAKNNNQANPTDNQSKVVIFGNSNFATNGFLIQQLNGDLFLNSIDWLVASDETPLALRPKKPTDRRIYLSAQQKAILSRIATAIVPLLGFILALITWLRRR